MISQIESHSGPTTKLYVVSTDAVVGKCAECTVEELLSVDSLLKRNCEDGIVEVEIPFDSSKKLQVYHAESSQTVS